MENPFHKTRTSAHSCAGSVVLEAIIPDEGFLPSRDWWYCACKGTITAMKRNFSGLTLEDVMQMIPQENLTAWRLSAPPRLPSSFLAEALDRFSAFDLTNSEAAKILLIDALLAETVPSYPGLKVWKAASLESETLTGVADYLIARKRAYLKAPLLCAVEAKRDDFEQGRTQCFAEMIACRQNNLRAGYDNDVFGIVSNGTGWQFYKLTGTGEIFESNLFTTEDLPRLLGVLDSVCADCARLAP